jgi:hypothetical protein
MIRKRRATISRYYDKFGPTFLCLGLLSASVVNFVFKIREDGWFQKSIDSSAVKAIFGELGSGEL